MSSRRSTKLTPARRISPSNIYDEVYAGLGTREGRALGVREAVETDTASAIYRR